MPKHRIREHEVDNDGNPTSELPFNPHEEPQQVETEAEGVRMSVGMPSITPPLQFPDVALDEWLEEQDAPNPASRVITPTEAAIAFASGAPIIPPVSPSVEPANAVEAPAVEKEVSPVSELFSDSEPIKFTEPVIEPFAREQSDDGPIETPVVMWPATEFVTATQTVVEEAPEAIEEAPEAIEVAAEETATAAIEPEAPAIETVAATIEPEVAETETVAATIEPVVAEIEPEAATIEPVEASIEMVEAVIEPEAVMIEPVEASDPVEEAVEEAVVDVVEGSVEVAVTERDEVEEAVNNMIQEETLGKTVPFTMVENVAPPVSSPAVIEDVPVVAAAGFIPQPEVTQEATPVACPAPAEVEEMAQEINESNITLASAEVLAVDQGFATTPMTEEPITVEEEPIERGITVITKEATVLGDILTEGHIDIVGRVKGNIDAKGDVAVHGIVRGDVGGAKIGLYNCRIKGNLDAGLGVIVDDGSIIGGDVKTKNIIFDGKVKGNIDAENVVVLRSNSYCLGDVSAASLAIEPGAILNGKVRTFVEGDLEAPFDEVI